MKHLGRWALAASRIGLAALTLALLLLWWASGTNWIWFSDGRATILYASDGVATIHVDRSRRASAFFMHGELGRSPSRSSLARTWIWSWNPLQVSLLPVAGGCAGLFAGSLLIRRRRLRPADCRGCGYDLTGNISGRCPECGAAAATTL